MPSGCTLMRGFAATMDGRYLQHMRTQHRIVPSFEVIGVILGKREPLFKPRRHHHYHAYGLNTDDIFNIIQFSIFILI